MHETLVNWCMYLIVSGRNSHSVLCFNFWNFQKKNIELWDILSLANFNCDYSQHFYLLLFNSSGGGPALTPWPCAVQIRPILVALVGGAIVVGEVVGFLIVADGCRRPVGFGKRDDAVDTSLLIDISDGVGDVARGGCCSCSCEVTASTSLGGFVSLMLFYFFVCKFVVF